MALARGPDLRVELSSLPWVVVQAGGPGTRMRHHTWNKPQCLISVGGQPILYHLFERFPAARFVVIADHQHEHLAAFLALNPPKVSVALVTTRAKGSAGGLRAALERVPARTPFALVWSDLLLGAVPGGAVADRPVVGLSRSFPCRWALSEAGALVEEGSNDRGVAGFFAFPERSWLEEVPAGGDLLRWISGQGWPLASVFLDAAQWIGEVSGLDDASRTHTWSRYFNDVAVGDTQVTKRPRSPEFAPLIEDEAEWYLHVARLGFDRAPEVLARSPLTLARVPGRHPFALAGSPVATVPAADAPRPREEAVLEGICATLDRLHALESVPPSREAMEEVYLRKTFERVRQVRPLLPHVDHPEVRVNGRLCRNPFAPGQEETLVARCRPLLDRCPRFTTIHGDPTFSNTLVDAAGRAFLIDPRGRFGALRFHGDPRYDWAKLYYSAVGGYDSFNRRRFTLQVSAAEVEVRVQPSGYAHLEPLLAARADPSIAEIRLLHALIWISLAGYVRDDYDSILGAFYNGLWWLEEAGP